MTALTADRSPVDTRFKAGNPGRPKGSRQKLATQFFNDIYAKWEADGPAILAQAAFQKPMEFAAMVAKLMPQKLEISTPTDGMSLDRMEQMIDLAERMVALKAAAASVTIDAAALPARRGGGSPQAGVAGGEVVEVVHYSPDYPTPLIDVTPHSAPTQEPLFGTSAEMPDMGIPTTLDSDEVDPASLY